VGNLIYPRYAVGVGPFTGNIVSNLRLIALLLWEALDAEQSQGIYTPLPPSLQLSHKGLSPLTLRE
jgi:hypothetical protein